MSKTKKRRSPRLAKAVDVKIAGKGADGSVLVEDTRTRDVSKYGASISTRRNFAVGSPIAIRRPGSEPMRAHVVSVKPDEEAGSLLLGIEFIGDDGHWGLDFPRDWKDFFQRNGQEYETEPEEKPAFAEDRALESLVRKAEALRNQAASMLMEFSSQVEDARRENSSALAAQVESFTSWKSIIEGESTVQVRAASESIRAETARILAQLEKDSAGLRQKIGDLTRECETSLHAAEETFQQLRLRETPKADEIVARVAADLELQRKTLADVQTQSAEWRRQTTAHLDRLKQDVQQALDKAGADIQNLVLGGIREYREKTPELGREMERFIAGIVSEQKASTTQWLDQTFSSTKTAMAGLESQARRTSEESSRQLLEQYQSGLQNRLVEFRNLGEAVAGPLGERLERARTSANELMEATDQRLAGSRQSLSSLSDAAVHRLNEASTVRLTEMESAGQAAQARLEQISDAPHRKSLETSRILEQTSADRQELNTGLQREGLQRHQDLETHFSSLMGMYDNRKEALDRLLETLEKGRAALRDGLDMLRVNTEENRARLVRVSAEQETSLGVRASELERKVGAAIVALEAQLQERVAGSLQSTHGAFSAKLEQSSQQGRERFHGLLEQEMAAASARLPELFAVLDRRCEELGQALAQKAADHTQGLSQARQVLDEKTAEHLEALDRRTGQSMQVLGQSAAKGVGKVEDQQAKALGAVAEVIGGIEQQQQALARVRSQTENEIQQWRQSVDAQFAALQGELDKKRASLDSFHTSSEQTKADIVKSMDTLGQRIEEGRASLDSATRQAQGTLDKYAGVLSDKMQETVRSPVESARQSVASAGESTLAAFQSRLKEFSDQIVASTERLMEHGGNAAALALDRTMQKERKEHERLLQELGQRGEDVQRDRHHAFQESAAASLNQLQDKAQQICREMLEQVREARETLAREMPARASEGEVEFRKNLERIQEQSLAHAAEAFRALCEQWITRTEMEIAQRKQAG